MTIYDTRYLYNYNSALEVEKYNLQFDKKNELSVQIIDEGVVLPRVASTCKDKWMGEGGVLDNNGEFVELSGIKKCDGNGLVFGGKYEYDSQDLVEIDERVIYLGALFNHWGHFLVDYITRLWYYIKVEKATLVYSGWGFEQGKLYGPYKRFFELLGIPEEQLIDIRVPTKFKTIIVPEQCYLRNQYSTRDYKETIEVVKNNINDEGLVAKKKVYFSRSVFVKKNKWYLEYGEKAIERTFEKNGFFVVDPSELSLDEQIFYMTNADVIAGIASSNMINTAFAKEGGRRIYIKKCLEMESEAVHMDFITNAREGIVIDGFFRLSPNYSPPIAIGPHMLGVTKPIYKYFSDNNMTVMPRSYYFFEKVKTFLWLSLVIMYKVCYFIYFKTIRKVVKYRKSVN